MKKKYTTPSVKEIAMRCDDKLLADSTIPVNNDPDNNVIKGEELSKDDAFDEGLW